MQKLPDAEFPPTFRAIKGALAKGATLDEILPEAFALAGKLDAAR